ncbi:Putative heterokaryon incompatibility [Septoria linicola]|uniref:Heterokaryon incompatibility n=1 Tax=Septoria linicola TaxID=215465 RepID=A0A9Q9EDL5_9PEZI|nr:putative heterokaryon incompatibility [Septoria linicola]USW46935.1 Putative heterokaryon incompatibility [Septoria linicola]
MSVDTQQFEVYKALPESSIRLLYLQPAKELTAPLIGTLEIVRLLEEPKYEALSYAWDGAFNEADARGVLPVDKAIPLPPATMQLERRLFSINGNLFHALRRLRHRSQTRVLWIDALCVDQGNDLERSAQVAMMAKIYSSASQVIVWLGEDSDDRDGKLFFELCRRHVQMLRTPWVHPWRKLLDYVVERINRRFGDSKGYWSSQDRLRPFFCLDAKKRYAALQKFGRRRYLFRRWCAQEIAVARDIAMICGAHVLPWQVFVSHALALDRPVWHSWTYPTSDILYYMKDLRTQHTNAFDVLLQTTQMKCSDERDYL